MRRLLSWASLSSCLLIVLAVLMQRRGSDVTDWLRVGGRDRAAVLACAGDSVGAAIFTDRDGWSIRDRSRVKYKQFKPVDLRRHFADTFHGFAYRNDRGAHLLLAPMWFFIAMGVTPPMLMLAGAGRKRP